MYIYYIYNLYIYVYTGIIYIHIYIHIYMLSSKQWALPVITTMALRQLMHLGRWCTMPKCMSCHKAIVVMIGRAHCFHNNICSYYAHLASVRFEHSACRGSFMSIYTHIYIYIHKLASQIIFKFWFQLIKPSTFTKWISSAYCGIYFIFFSKMFQ